MRAKFINEAFEKKDKKTAKGSLLFPELVEFYNRLKPTTKYLKCASGFWKNMVIEAKTEENEFENNGKFTYTWKFYVKISNNPYTSSGEFQPNNLDPEKEEEFFNVIKDKLTPFMTGEKRNTLAGNPWAGPYLRHCTEVRNSSGKVLYIITPDDDLDNDNPWDLKY